MIRYQLICGRGHDFDAWFADSAAFDAQRDGGLLGCPHCGGADVEKALMAPAVPSKRRKSAATPGAPQAPETPAGGGDQVLLGPEPGARELAEALKQLRRQVTANADYVGGRFAEEARKIHYREAEARGIWGEASAEEARALCEEGIEFHPLPVLPEDRN